MNAEKRKGHEKGHPWGYLFKGCAPNFPIHNQHVTQKRGVGHTIFCFYGHVQEDRKTGRQGDRECKTPSYDSSPEGKELLAEVVDEHEEDGADEHGHVLDNGLRQVHAL